MPSRRPPPKRPGVENGRPPARPAMTERHLIVHSDGAARGNPGPGGAGWVIETLSGELVEEGSAYLGERTNNQAEYEALLYALAAVRPDHGTYLEIYSDSELMVRQLNGHYRVKNADLADRHGAALDLLDRAAGVVVRHVSRDENRRADELANRAIDVHLRALQGPVGQTAAGRAPAEREARLEESPGSTGQDARGGAGDGRNARHPSG